MSHTPGPWEIDLNTRPAEVCTVYNIPTQPSEDGKGQEWCYIRGALGYWGADEKENMANANLIAAAPELLEALEAARIFIRNGIELGYIRMPDPDTPDSAHDVPPMIAAAIAKAKGEA